MSSKICNSTSNKGLSYYFSKKKQLNLGKVKNLKVTQRKLLLNDDFFKNNADVIVLITWLMLKCLLKSKYVLYEVSSDLGKMNNFYSSFSDTVQKAPPFLSKVRKNLRVIALK